MGGTGTAYVVEMLGRTLAERDQQLAQAQQEIDRLRQELANAKEQ